MKIHIPANENAMVTLKKQMGLLFAQLQSIDNKTLIYGFKDDFPTHALREPKDVPDNIMTFREFIIGASLREGEGFTWATAWIGHDKPITDILTNMKYWSKLKRSLIFEKALQVKYSVRDYFLLWSHGKMDKKTLHGATTAAINSLTKTKYKFAFTWTALKGCTGQFLRLSKKENNGNTIVKALHIEVPRDERDATYNIMRVIFGLDSGFSILGTELLLVPIIRDTIPSHKIENIHHLVVKQKQFLDKLEYAKTYDFTEIDHRCSSMELTIREILMELQTLDGTGAKLFWSVDYDDKDDGYHLTYPRFLKTQARDIISQLPSLLVFICGPDVLYMMTELAQTRAREAPWDANEMRAISQEDKALAAMIDKAKQMQMCADPNIDTSESEDDDSVDEEQICLEMDRVATERHLFTKASTNNSITTLDTKVNDHKTARNSDDEPSVTGTPSTQKKPRSSPRMATPEDNDDMELDMPAQNVSSVTSAMSAAMNLMQQTTQIDHRNAIDSEQTGLSVTEKALPPGPVIGPEEGP